MGLGVTPDQRGCPDPGRFKRLIPVSASYRHVGQTAACQLPAVLYSLTLLFSVAACFPTENPGQNLNKVFQEVPKRRAGSEGTPRSGRCIVGDGRAGLVVTGRLTESPWSSS